MANSTASTTTSTRFLDITSSTLTPVALVALRIGAGLLFMQHGAQKLFGLLGGMGGSGAPAELMSQLGLAGVLEFFGGALVVVGLFTRPVAAVLTILMLVAFSIAHLPQGGFPIQNGGELSLLYALVFGFFAATGTSAWSLDNLRRSSPEPSHVR